MEIWGKVRTLSNRGLFFCVKAKIISGKMRFYFVGSVKRILTSDETDVRLSILTKITDYLGLSFEVK